MGQKLGDEGSQVLVMVMARDRAAAEDPGRAIEATAAPRAAARFVRAEREPRNGPDST